MKKRFSEEQIIGFLRGADAGMQVKELCRKHGFSDAAIYGWRTKFRGVRVVQAQPPEVPGAREREIETPVGRLDAGHRGVESGRGPKALTQQDRREAVATMRERTQISTPRACRLAGVSRTVFGYEPKPNAQNEMLPRGWSSSRTSAGALAIGGCTCCRDANACKQTTNACSGSTGLPSLRCAAGASVWRSSESRSRCQGAPTRSGRWIL